MTEADREQEERRWEKTRDDAIALKKARPELVVNVPALRFTAEVEAFFAPLAHMAERGDSFTSPHVARGAVIYTTIHGRLHRMIVEDIEPELRQPAPAEVFRLSVVCTTCSDTHVMQFGERDPVPCTRCPVPCQSCRKDGNGAYCADTPCPCDCHPLEIRGRRA